MLSYDYEDAGRLGNAAFIPAAAAYNSLYCTVKWLLRAVQSTLGCHLSGFPRIRPNLECIRGASGPGRRGLICYLSLKILNRQGPKLLSIDRRCPIVAIGSNQFRHVLSNYVST